MHVDIHEHEAVCLERDRARIALVEANRLLSISESARLAAQVSLQAEIESRNRMGLAIDKALRGVVHDHPLADRLHVIANLRADMDREAKRGRVLLVAAQRCLNLLQSTPNTAIALNGAEDILRTAMADLKGVA